MRNKSWLLFCLISLLINLGCTEENNKSAQIENKLDSAIKLIDSYRSEKHHDSLAQESKMERLKDSIQNKSFENDLSTIYESVKNAVLFVYTTDDYYTNQGSAFLIDADGTCISNYHIFKNAIRGKVKTCDGNTFSIVDIISKNEEKDYIVFKVALGGANIAPLTVSKEQPKIGEDCFAIGNPRGLSQTLSKGIVSGFRNNRELIQITAEITHGSSGGALFNKKGEVIGITTSGYGEADLNFAVNIDNVRYNSKVSNYSSLSPNSTLNFIVISERAYFHNEPNYETKRRGYLLKGNQAIGLKTENNFVYIDFTNSIGQNSKGWIPINDISFE